MGWSVDYGWGYNGNTSGTSGVYNHALQLLSYKNDGTTPVVIRSCFLYMASGKATFTGGDTVTGTGQAYSVYVYGTGSDGVKDTSNTVDVTNTCGTSYSGQSKKTFTFPRGIYVAAGATIKLYFYIKTSATSGLVVCANHDYSTSKYGGSVSNAGGIVRIKTSDGWVPAIPYIKTDDGWVPATPYIKTSSGWTICK